MPFPANREYSRNIIQVCQDVGFRPTTRLPNQSANRFFLAVAKLQNQIPSRAQQGSGLRNDAFVSLHAAGTRRPSFLWLVVAHFRIDFVVIGNIWRIRDNDADVVA